MPGALGLDSARSFITLNSANSTTFFHLRDKGEIDRQTAHAMHDKSMHCLHFISATRQEIIGVMQRGHELFVCCNVRL